MLGVLLLMWRDVISGTTKKADQGQYRSDVMTFAFSQLWSLKRGTKFDGAPEGLPPHNPCRCKSNDFDPRSSQGPIILNSAWLRIHVPLNDDNNKNIHLSYIYIYMGLTEKIGEDGTVKLQIKSMRSENPTASKCRTFSTVPFAINAKWVSDLATSCSCFGAFEKKSQKSHYGARLQNRHLSRFSWRVDDPSKTHDSAKSLINSVRNTQEIDFTTIIRGQSSALTLERRVRPESTLKTVQLLDTVRAEKLCTVMPDWRSLAVSLGDNSRARALRAVPRGVLAVAKL